MKASTNQVSYHQLMTVTIIYWQLRSTGWLSDLQLRSTGSDSYDQLPDNFEVQIFAPSWIKTHGHSWNTLCDMTPTCQCHMGTVHGQVFLISSIVWSHSLRSSPSWLVVTAVGRNCYSPVYRLHRGCGSSVKYTYSSMSVEQQIRSISTFNFFTSAK